MITAADPPLLFIHIPKTGGSTVVSVLEQVLPSTRTNKAARHQTLSEALAGEPQLADRFVFGFVRNPWARMVSWWAMIQAAAKRAEDGNPMDIGHFRQLPVWRAVRAAADFETYIAEVCPRVARLSRPQVDWLTAESRSADFIGRTEQLESDLHHVFQRLGLPRTEVPTMNATPHADYRTYYSPRTRDVVGEMFAADVEAFGYAF